MVSDNFSKAILGSITAQSNGAVNVVEALKRAVKTMEQHHPHLRTASLIVDGGSENHAEEVTRCLNEIAPPEIQRHIALKDVQFSNSPVEAINKILKCYLRHFKRRTYKDFERVVANAIHDYNHIQPHGSLNGLTLMEAYTVRTPNMDFTSELEQAKATRLLQNKGMVCEVGCKVLEKDEKRPASSPEAQINEYSYQ